MDPTRFDSLTRALHQPPGSSATRRGLLLSLGSALVAFTMQPLADIAARKRKKNRCRGSKKNLTFCYGAGCRDLSTDPAHCGRCGLACEAGQTCVDRACTGPSSCTPNCQNVACGADNGCGGICTNGSCSAGKTCRSDGACVDAGCNPPCGFNSSCQNGTCVPAANYCPVPFVCGQFESPVQFCGTTAPAGSCGCYRTTEGNNACVNITNGQNIPLDPTLLPTCRNTQDCRAIGFHTFCLAVNQHAGGRICGEEVSRCWPQCDAPDPVFRETKISDPGVAHMVQEHEKRRRERGGKRKRSSRRER